MDLIKLLPILFVVAQGEGRAVEQPQQLLPVIPGYVPVYIQTGPQVEVIYETGRKVVHDSERKGEKAAADGEDLIKKEMEELKKKEEDMKKKKKEQMALEEQKKQEVAKEEESKKNEEDTEEKKTEEGMNSIVEPSESGKGDKTVKGEGSVLEVGNYQVKESRR